MTADAPDGPLWALRLAGSAADVAALAVLAEAAPDLLEGPWSCVQERDAAGSALTSPGLGAALAAELLRRGLDLVQLATEGDDITLTPPAGDPTPWRAPLVRAAPRLVEAVRPRRLAGDPLVDEALFLMRPDSPSPARLIGRLLLLGRGDVQVGSFDDAAGGSRFAVRLKAPPLYLLMSARDGDDDVVAYARHGTTSLWVAWSYDHPLAAAAAAALSRVGQAALVDRDGAWLRAPTEWRTRSIYDVLAPTLDADRVALRPADAELRFRVELRLAPGPPADADLWLLTPDQLLDLEPLIDACTSDELGRLTLARLCGEGGTHYLLRERVRPGATRMAARVSETLDVPGYAQVAGADNLYIPTGRRLTPMLRRDDLRRLLGLDRAHTVVLTEDRDGPRLVTIAEVEEAPLLRWIDYVATDRRLELDRLLERSVFEFPEITIAWPEVRRPAPERPPTRERRAEARARRAIRRDPAAEDQPEPEVAETDAAARLRALRERARALEGQLVAGGCDEVAPWHELGALKAELGDPDEAVACLEAAVFHGGPPYDPELARELVEVTAAMFPRAAPEDQITELVVQDRRSATAAARLGALIVERLAAGAPPPDEVMQLALPVFTEARTPVSRRLAWAVLAAWYHHARDRLGLTRAKEAVLGGVNERGLSDLHDLPRFVRNALAREDEDPAEASEGRARQSQLAALEALWHDASAGLTDLDVGANFTRLIFAVGFARLGARGAAQELIAPVEAELDVHEPPNRALFRLYIARLAHETAGSSAEAWATDVGRILEGLRDPRHKQVVQWLVRRSMWLGAATGGDESFVGREVRFKLPPELEIGALAEHLAREMTPAPGRYDYLIAEAVDVCLRRALASGSEAVLGEVLAAAEPRLDTLAILSHRAEAIGACIHGAACLGDDAALGRLIDALVEVARSQKLDSARELARATQRCLVALRRFGGLEPARALMESLATAQVYTTNDRVHLLSTVAAGFMQLGEGQAADALLDRLCASIFDGSLDYVSRAQAGLAAASALRHWPNIARVERFRRFVAGLDAFRDTFTTNRYYDTHRVQILEATVDCLADSRTRQSDRIQGFLDQEEHALRRRIIADWSAVCGR